jgi:hypothetical protein
MAGVQFPVGAVMGFLLLATASRPALGPTQPPIQWAPGAVSPGLKRQGCEANHPPSSTSILPLPQYFFMVWRLPVQKTRNEHTSLWSVTVVNVYYMWHSWKRRERHTKFLIGKREGKRPVERPSHRWEGNIKTDHKRLGFEGVDSIHLVSG